MRYDRDDDDWGPHLRFLRRLQMPGVAHASAGGPPPFPPNPFPPFPPFPAGFPFGGPRGRRRRGRGRMRRGAIRAGILVVLADRPMHGYEVMTELAERSGGMWRPSPGSVYPTLAQLEDEDLVRSEELDGKRTFSLTDAGRAEAERVKEKGEPWAGLDEDGGEEQRAFHESLGQLMAAVQQVVSAGTDEQVAAAQRLLDDARKAIYRVLGD